MAVLKDLRRYQAMIVAEADAIFLRMAKLKAVIDKETASHKKRLAEMEMAHKDKLASAVAEYEALDAELAAYGMAHQDRFIKPRKHPVGQIGSYGFTTNPAYARITDKEELIAYAIENGFDDLYRVERTPDKDAAIRRILAGETIPGAEAVPPGDVFKAAFKKGYAEQLEN